MSLFWFNFWFYWIRYGSWMMITCGWFQQAKYHLNIFKYSCGSLLLCEGKYSQLPCSLYALLIFECGEKLMVKWRKQNRTNLFHFEKKNYLQQETTNVQCQSEIKVLRWKNEKYTHQTCHEKSKWMHIMCNVFFFFFRFLLADWNALHSTALFNTKQS